MMNKTTVKVFIIVTSVGFIGILFHGSANYDLTSLKTSLSIGGVNSDVRDERHFRMHENDTLDKNAEQMDFKSWEMMASEHWKKIQKPENLLEVKRPEYDKRFKNPCWYDTKTRLHCLPYFYLTGIKKSGTTSIFQAITQHPDIVTNTSKEIQWFPRIRFDSYRTSSFKFFVDTFFNSAKVIEAQLKEEPLKLNSKIIGDGTPANLHLNSHWRYLPENAGLSEPKYVIHDYIHHLTPQAKIIAIFRDPIDRLYSDYYHEYENLRKLTNTSNHHFHEVATKGLQLYKDCFKHFTRRSCVYNETIYQYTWMNIQLGIYHVYWEDLLRIYPRDQLLIVHKLDMETNLEKTLQRIYEYLGLHPLPESLLTSIAKNTDMFTKSKYIGNDKRQRMLPETHELLEEFYQPFNEIMADITNDRRFLYHSN